MILSVILIEKIRHDNKASAASYLLYDKKTKVLTVTARKGVNANVIKVNELVDYNVNYHPSEMVYTGVTVGGVHTGAVHDVGNYYSLDGKKTQKYNLIYTGIGVADGDYGFINEIKLDPSLIPDAKENEAISKYLNEEGVLILQNSASSKYGKHAVTAMNQNRSDLAMQMFKMDYYEQQLTYEQCKTIKDWICAL